MNFRFAPALSLILMLTCASFSLRALGEELEPATITPTPMATTRSELDAVTLPNEDVPDPPLGQRILELSLDLSRYDYAEDFPAPGKSTEYGTMPGLAIFFRRQAAVTSNFWAVGFEFSPGGTRYDGTTQGPKFTPVQKDTSNQFLRAEGTYGINVLCVNRDVLPGCLKAYAGLGFRIWKRGNSQIVDGIASPSEHYTWLNLPIGIRFEKQWGENWELALDASVRWMFRGQIVVKLSEVSSLYEDAYGTLGSTWGGRIELAATRRLSSKLSMRAMPWYELSRIGEGGSFDIRSGGQVIGQGFEPASRTHQYGLRLGIALSL